MTLFLASVRNAAEAETALGAGADIIDLKEPSQGALGALSPELIGECVASIAGRAPVSATIGDLPLGGTGVRDAVRATAAMGVDFVKVGLFSGVSGPGALDLLEEEAAQIPLILVAFADAWPDFDPVAAAARIGAYGVMLDTAAKHAGSLLDHRSLDALSGFVAAARSEGLNVGLSGSLKAGQIPSLLRLAPDLVGFRGALCRAGTREAAIDPLSCASIRALIPRAPPGVATLQLSASRASALC